ncbi:MAG: hypothetical protein HYV34_04240 [Candidatus Kerfeldbacteria bacterium]|nr:hypothetical protein [Candidatus Kerfeldbacteria bacterium]
MKIIATFKPHLNSMLGPGRGRRELSGYLDASALVAEFRAITVMLIVFAVCTPADDERELRALLVRLGLPIPARLTRPGAIMVRAGDRILVPQGRYTLYCEEPVAVVRLRARRTKP